MAKAPQRAQLAVPRSEADRVLTERRTRGEALLEKVTGVSDALSLPAWRRETSKWYAVTREALLAIYENSAPVESFESTGAYGSLSRAAVNHSTVRRRQVSAGASRRQARGAS